MPPKTIAIASTLRAAVNSLEFGAPVTHIYNPLDYAWAPHQAYLQRFGAGPKDVVLVGMNPGPFGMAQTGVPFGDIAMVREWIGIDAPVARPENEHPKRPVEGFACKRSEVSGTRLWSWARERFGTPERFFERFFVLNYCPLVFMEQSGKNRTPDKLPLAEQQALFTVCDRALAQTVEALDARFVIGIGAFAEKRILNALDDSTRTIGRILHPSPASPKANRGWAAQAEQELVAIGAL